MIAKNLKHYCCDSISSIENYALAINDVKMWHLHHRLETHDINGNKRKENVSKKELIENDLYFNRPANELIFLEIHDHLKLHSQNNEYAKGKNIGNQNAKGNVLTAETRKQMGLSRVGNINNGLALIRCVETNEIHRTREWISLGYANAYNVAKGRQKTCHGYHFVYV